MAAPALSPLPANWATGAFRQLPPEPVRPTQFEITVARLQLANSPHLWPYDQALKAWVKANKNKKYVPEELLSIWDMHVVMED